MTNLSQQLCKICGIEPKRVRPFQCDKNKENIPCEFCIEKHGKCISQKEIYPDFEKPENYKKLQEVFINNDHSITPSRDLCAISNGDTDFIHDTYDTSFSISGATFLKAVYNYLTLWIEQTTEVMISSGEYSEPIDTSHKLTRRECIYPRGYDDLLKDVKRIKQAIRETEWVYE